MRKYCRAYPLQAMRQFSNWHEQAYESASQLPDDTICYLWDDLVVVLSPILEQSTLFDEITPKWQQFCRETLDFRVPEDVLN